MHELHPLIALIIRRRLHYKVFGEEWMGLDTRDHWTNDNARPVIHNHGASAPCAIRGAVQKVDEAGHAGQGLLCASEGKTQRQDTQHEARRETAPAELPALVSFIDLRLWVGERAEQPAEESGNDHRRWAVLADGRRIPHSLSQAGSIVPPRVPFLVVLDLSHSRQCQAALGAPIPRYLQIDVLFERGAWPVLAVRE